MGPCRFRLPHPRLRPSRLCIPRSSWTAHVGAEMRFLVSGEDSGCRNSGQEVSLRHCQKLSSLSNLYNHYRQYYDHGYQCRRCHRPKEQTTVNNEDDGHGSSSSSRIPVPGNTVGLIVSERHPEPRQSCSFRSMQISPMPSL